ncbi:SAM-dependent methyltransferase [Gallionella capsiferriformans]|jgi:16S rRNA (cytidine1402-2'-O)-methyltransferase|uniref:Uroporphyrin-III C/tetrapyrrole (Corrin/Porphyrin) methyltransferase n=1 Tax=Gallionella capsiferriformans (strain ES-2) TaxID=395494 RepID=D9SGC9_GALCS|nr:SAM-dependent methyltransferase [Gallionella capsiferriformans]ADL55576.1 Uroporphyrin-III C/tetrapyrrole (Corrin/Porphyrin) methyltransferase [Gallionella capsiferriformans ES-2]
MTPTPGTLFLIPCTLGDTPAEQVLPQHVINVARSLQYYVVEQLKTARQFLSALKHEQPIQSLHFETLNEHTAPAELSALLSPLLAGHDVGIISEAGCPGIADPGAALVELAHKNGIRVIPLVGPSSILLALMASGMNGQCFAFHGYLPINDADRSKAIAQLEAESASRRQTQLFIETPYRNDKLFQALLAKCQPRTLLCVATDVSLASEQIQTRTIQQWKSQPAPQLNKRPSLFLLLANK